MHAHAKVVWYMRAHDKVLPYDKKRLAFARKRRHACPPPAAVRRGAPRVPGTRAAARSTVPRPVRPCGGIGPLARAPPGPRHGKARRQSSPPHPHRPPVRR